MSRKIEVPNSVYWINRYQAGESIPKLAREAGVNAKVMRRIVREAVGTLRDRRMDIPELDTILERYLAGETEQALAFEYGLARTVLRRRLLEAGIAPRTISDTMLTRWATATPEQRDRMLSSAHKAARGSRQTIAAMERSARGRERTLSHATPIENMLAGWLRERGFTLTQQKAIGKYNADIAMHEPPIAIEIFGGGFHSSGPHGSRHHERIKYLLDNGWAILIIWIDAKHYPLSVACADEVVRFCDHLRALPSPRREYRVIRGDGYPAPASEKYFNSASDIERLACAH